MIGKLLIKLLVLYQLNGKGVHRHYVSGTRLGRVDNCPEAVTVTLSPSVTTSVSSLVLTRTVPSCVTGNRDHPATTVRTLTTTVTSTVVLTTVAERQRESVLSKAQSELVITPQSQLSSCPSTTVTKTCNNNNNNNNTTTVDCVAKITGENIVEVALPWHAARQECRRRGGDLATPCYPADFINHIRDNYHKNALFWLGASDTESPNTFKWTTGASVAGPWYPGHPQEGRSGFHCLGIQYTDERQSGIISGYDCTSSRWYICSR